MIAGFLRNNHLGAILFIPVLAILLWLPTLLHTQLHPVFDGMPLFVLVDSQISQVPYLPAVVAVVLIILEALLLNVVVVQHLVTPKDNYLIAGLYVVLMSSSRSFLTLHPILFANLFLILSLRSVFMMHRKETAFGNAFDAGIYISIASLFYLPALFFFPLLGFSYVLMRPFIWREWVISLMGLLVPYLFVGLYYFWIGDLLYLWHNRLPFTFEGKITGTSLPSSNYFFLIMGGILSVFAMFNLFNSVAALSLKARSTSYVMFWFMVFAAVILIASPKYKAPYTGLLFIPMSVFIANYLLQVKKNWWREFCFLGLLGAIIYNIMLR
jgi:hypothetical protein